MEVYACISNGTPGFRSKKYPIELPPLTELAGLRGGGAQAAEDAAEAGARARAVQHDPRLLRTAEDLREVLRAHGAAVLPDQQVKSMLSVRGIEAQLNSPKGQILYKYRYTKSGDWPLEFCIVIG